MKRVGQGMRNNGAVFLHMSSNKKLSPVVKVPYHGKASKAFPYRPVPVAPDALYKRKAGISFALHGLDRKHALVKLAYGQKRLL